MAGETLKRPGPAGLADRLDGYFLFFLLICGRKSGSDAESDQGLLNAAEIARNTR